MLLIDSTFIPRWCINLKMETLTLREKKMMRLLLEDVLFTRRDAFAFFMFINVAESRDGGEPKINAIS
ncbi:uncharacterized [Tachysurus ichikawai]